jgi:multiple antibiotic resistance protein
LLIAAAPDWPRRRRWSLCRKQAARGEGGLVNDIVNAVLLVYAGLFPIVNPVGGAPIFLSLTHRFPDAERRALAGRVALNSFLLLLASLFVGSYVLEFFGISLSAVRVAGGLVVSSFAWQLLHAGVGVDQRSAHNSDPPVDGFYPLTMPLTVGPGSISVAITLGSHRPRAAVDLPHLAMLIGGAVAGLVAVSLTIFLCYRFAERIVTALGERGTSVMIRLSAFILLCIGIEILWDGVNGFIELAKTAAGTNSAG